MGRIAGEIVLWGAAIGGSGSGRCGYQSGPLGGVGEWESGVWEWEMGGNGVFWGEMRHTNN